MPRFEPRLAGAAAAAVLISAAASSSAASSGSDPGGLALLAKVHHAYSNVPGVSISGTAGPLTFHYLLALRSGIGVAEEFVGRQPSSTTRLVAHGHPTFAYDAGRSCWTALAASAPQTFENIGIHFPDQPGMSVRSPVATARGWNLTMVAEGTPATLAIDRKSLRIRSIVVKTPGAAIVEHVRDLSSAPELAEPKPRC